MCDYARIMNFCIIIIIIIIIDIILEGKSFKPRRLTGAVHVFAGLA